jgi:two-component system response regulator HydG
VSGFSEKAMQALCDYDYPGNVRELENLVERAVILSTDEYIEPGEWLPGALSDAGQRSRLERMEQAEIRRLLDAHQGNLGRVAKELGVSRTTLWRRMKDYRCLA